MAAVDRMNLDGSVNVPEYRRTLGAFMTGVTVVTTVDNEGRNRGMTMNSFTSVSLDPPLVLVCVDVRAASYNAFIESSGFAVHILGADQQELALKFASKSTDKFAGVDTYTGEGSAPIITDVHAWIDCSTDNVIVAGDHAILLGRVLNYDAQDRRPLAFYQGKFNSFGTDEEIVRQQASTAGRTWVKWVVETADEHLVLHEHDRAFTLPESRLEAAQLSDAGLSAAATSALGTEIVIDFLYSLYDGESGDAVLVYRGRVIGANPHPNAPYVLVPTHEAHPARFSSEPESAVIERYARERVGSVFGVYAGSQLAGTVAALGAASASR